MATCVRLCDSNENLNRTKGKEQKSITQIYTDWGNHYLDKIKSKRRIQHLPVDVTDGVVLADVIEAVTNQKLPDVNRKPRNASQMIDNISTCLRLLTALGIPLDDVTAADIHQGNLKSVLTVFFALSRYKQQQKQQQQQHQNQEMAKIPVAKSSVTSIPVCAGKAKQPQTTGSKIALPSSGHYGTPQLRPSLNSSTATSAASSRSASPSLCSTGSGNLTNGNSLIPRTPLQKTNGIKANSIKTPVAVHAPLNKQSMLDKLKFFKPIDKPQATLSKRPSSSSGFSSARSEQSDSSFASTNGNVSATPLTTLAVFDQPVKKSSPPAHVQITNGTKERSIRTRSKNSPKLSPKVKHRSGEVVEEARSEPQQAAVIVPSVMANKPAFGGLGSGIPKPTAAVKGTAKIIKKPTVTTVTSTASNEDSTLERTPGDGKEVPVSKLTKLAPPSPVAKSFANPLSHLESIHDCQPKVASTLQCETPKMEANASQGMVTSEDQPVADQQLHEPESVQLVANGVENCLVADQPAEVPRMSSRSTLGGGPVAKVSPMPTSNGPSNGPSEPLNDEDDVDEPMNVQPMSPLLNTSNLSLMKRNNNATACYASDNEAVTCSKSSSSAKRSANAGYSDPLDGYLSEGGASLYARKLHYLAVTQQQQQQQQRQRHKDDDSFDDCSSLSSGVSDPWNDVYGLHLKMEHSSVYPGYGTPLQNRRHPPAVVESSPYKQISSSQWKKFIEAGRLPSSERFQTDLWKPEVRDSSRSQQSHEESPKRSSEHKKLNTAPADQQSSRRKVNGVDGSDVRQQPQQQLQQQAAKGSPSSFGYVKKSSGTSTSDSLKRHELTNGKSSLSYKTANVTAVPKLNDASAEAVPACYNRSLERPKTRLKVSGGTQTDMNNSPRSSKTTAKLPPSVKSVSQSAPPAQQPTQHYASFSDSEYHSVNGLKFQPANPAAGVAKGSAVPSNLPASFKSYSLTAPIANQLSQNIRERIMLNGTQSLPKSHLAQLKAMEDKRLAHAHIAAHLFAGVGELQNNTDTNNSMDLNLDSPANANTFNGAVDKLRDKEKSIKYVASGRPHPHPNHHTDGSLSDTPYTAYWNKYAHPAKNPNELLSDPESLDSVPMQAPKLLWLNNPPSPRLNRSNSVRSTKSEKLYPSMLQRNNEDNNGAELNYPVSNHHVLDGHANNADGARYTNSSPVANSGPAHSVSRSSLGNYSALLSLSRMASKEEDCHGSSLSLVSTASSLYSSQEEKQAAEIRKLRRELNEAQEKVNTLSGQLSTNAHVVSAFEQSLASMTSRLQSLTLTAEQKENELQDLRQFIDQLRKQGIEASMPTVRSEHHVTNNLSPAHRQLSTDSVSSLASQLTNLSSASSSSPQAANGGAGSAQMAIPSASSPSPSPSLKKKSWLRNSFSKAFSRSKRGQSSSRGGSDTEDSGPVSTWSAPSSPLLASHHPHHPSIHSQSTHSSLDESASTPEMVDELKKQLREKDMVLTDIRLEALSSAHQLEALKETVSRMRNEMLSLKQDNERLQRHIEQVTQQNSTQSSAHNSTEHVNVQGLRASSTVDAPITTDLMLGLDIDKESKAIPVRIHIREYDDIILEDISEQSDHIWLLGYTGVSGKTRWDLLDASIRQLFAEYVRQIDPASHLGLDEDCLWYYRVGEVVRSLVSSDEGGDDDEFNAVPELLPCGYLVGDYNQIHVFIKTARKFSLPASLTLDTLVPLPILNRYLSLLHEHRRIVLSGPSGTGKSYLARKLAENCLVKQRGHRSSPNITTLKVDSAGCKEVRHLLAQISENLASGNTNDVPDVIILEDLHLASSLNDVLAPLSQLETSKVADGDDVRTPFVIGTTGPVIQQSTAQLQLQYNLRWILLANHTEPVQGLLSRFLRRRLIESELKSKTRDRELEKVVEWIPRCWAHLNRFLESHNSADVTIGPRWFLLVPADSTCSQVWFTDLWNYTLGPYLLHAAKEGLQLYGKRSPWEDPAQWVLSTYPWNQGSAYDALMRLRSEDVGYDTATRPRSLSTNNQTNEQDRDPLFNMLIKLQEAAGLPSPTENSEQDDVSSESQNSCETKEEDC